MDNVTKHKIDLTFQPITSSRTDAQLNNVTRSHWIIGQTSCKLPKQ